MESGDNQEYERRTRQHQRLGLFLLAIVIVAAAVGLALRWWPA